MTEDRFHPADPDGVLLDYIQFGAWQGLIHWAATREDLMRHFWATVGLRFPHGPQSALDAAIDKAAGYDPKAEVEQHFPAFVRWVTREHWGEDEITPSIRAALDRLPS